MNVHLRVAGQRWAVGAALITAVVSSACATVPRTGADTQPGVIYDRYTAFTFDETDLRPSGDPRVDGTPWLERRLHAAIQWELETRGIELDGAGPALTVHHHVSMQDVVDVVETDRRAGYEWSAEEHEPLLVEYQAATFVVGIADAETRQIIWRGWATLEAGRRPDDPEWIRTHVDDAFASMFRRFPRVRARTRAD